MVVGLVEQPGSERGLRTLTAFIRRGDLEQRVADAAARRPSRLVPILDVEALPDGAQIDAARQALGPHGAAPFELSPGVLDPLPMLVNEGTDLGRARAARYDDLQGMGRHESQGQIACPPALAHAERSTGEICGPPLAARVEKSELLRHRRVSNTSAAQNATALALGYSARSPVRALCSAARSSTAARYSGASSNARSTRSRAVRT